MPFRFNYRSVKPRPLTKREQEITAYARQSGDPRCRQCNVELVVRCGPNGPFWTCRDYPACGYAEDHRTRPVPIPRIDWASHAAPDRTSSQLDNWRRTGPVDRRRFHPAGDGDDGQG